MTILDWQTPAALLTVAGALGYLLKPWRFFRKGSPKIDGACGAGGSCGCPVPKPVFPKRS